MEPYIIILLLGLLGLTMGVNLYFLSQKVINDQQRLIEGLNQQIKRLEDKLK